MNLKHVLHVRGWNTQTSSRHPQRNILMLWLELHGPQLIFEPQISVLLQTWMELRTSLMSGLCSGSFRDLLHHLLVYVCSECDLWPLQKPTFYLWSASWCGSRLRLVYLLCLGESWSERGCRLPRDHLPFLEPGRRSAFQNHTRVLGLRRWLPVKRRRRSQWWQSVCQTTFQVDLNQSPLSVNHTFSQEFRSSQLAC